MVGSEEAAGAWLGPVPAGSCPASPSVAGEYHDSDFDWCEAEAEAAALLASLGCRQTAKEGTVLEEVADLEGPAASAGAGKSWERFHAWHVSARFFKPRRYLLHAFPALRSEGLRLLELGCGAGASLIPVLAANQSARAVGCDISASALALARRGAQATGIDPARLDTRELDLERNSPLTALSSLFDAVLLVFTLSALSEHGAACALRAAHAALGPGGRCLVRDYGLYDMAHLRFLAGGGASPSSSTGTPTPARAFRRGDGTLARFLALQELVAASAAAGLECEEARYACVAVRRSGAPDLRRVFVHAVFRKAAGSGRGVPGSQGGAAVNCGRHGSPGAGAPITS